MHQGMIGRIGAQPSASERRRGGRRAEDAELGDRIAGCLLREEVRLVDVELTQLVDGHPRAPGDDDIGALQAAVRQGSARHDGAEAVGHDGQGLVVPQ